MSEMIVCPHCGVAWSAGPAEPARPAGPADDEFPEEAVAAVPLLASGSNDDTFLAPAIPSRSLATSPDPILTGFVEPGPGPPTPPPGSRDLFLGLDLSAPRSAAGPGKSKPTADPEPDGSEEGPPGRTPWSTVLLASYASASTLALAWLLFGARRGAEPRPADPPAAAFDTRADPGRLAPLSRKVEPPGPIADDRMVALGKSLKVGSLEIIPVDVRRQDVLLRRVDMAGRPESRPGGKGALVLRLKVQNLSPDLVFAPVDPGFVREAGEGVLDSFIETAKGAKVYPFPLAVESELSIVGQDFAALRPGETRVVAIASAPDAPGDDQGPFVWRVRLRTGIDQTATIGVRWPGPTPGKP